MTSGGGINVESAALDWAKPNPEMHEAVARSAVSFSLFSMMRNLRKVQQVGKKGS
jgi:hypothetical protein